MRIPVVTPKRALRPLAVAAVLVAIVCLCIALKATRDVRAVRTPSGTVIRLERYAFQPGSVPYYSTKPPVARLATKVLPEAALKRIPWLRPQVNAVVTAPFAEEPLLSVAFSSRNPTGKIEGPGTRVVALDDHGQSFDPVVNNLGASGVFEVNPFPRRGRILRLLLMNGDNTLAEFSVRNPCPGPHPVWKPEHTPVTTTNGAITITLESFVSDATSLSTRCVLWVRENGTETTAWQPDRLEISDATGNHWCPRMDGPLTNENGHITLSSFGALWPEEEAWKLRLRLKAAPDENNVQAIYEVEFLVKPQQVTNNASAPQPMKTLGERDKPTGSTLACLPVN